MAAPAARWPRPIHAGHWRHSRVVRRRPSTGRPRSKAEGHWTQRSSWMRAGSRRTEWRQPAECIAEGKAEDAGRRRSARATRGRAQHRRLRATAVRHERGLLAGTPSGGPRAGRGNASTGAGRTALRPYEARRRRAEGVGAGTSLRSVPTGRRARTRDGRPLGLSDPESCAPELGKRCEVRATAGKRRPAERAPARATVAVEHSLR